MRGLADQKTERLIWFEVCRPITPTAEDPSPSKRAAQRPKGGGDGLRGKYRLVGGTFSCCFDGFSVSHFVVRQRLYPCPFTVFPNIGLIVKRVILNIIQCHVILISHQGNLD